MSRERLYPPDWLDASTAAYMVSMSVDTFRQRVEDGLLPKPTIVGGKHLWNRIRLSDALDSLDPTTRDPIDPIREALRGQKATGRRRFAA